MKDKSLFHCIPSAPAVSKARTEKWPICYLKCMIHFESAHITFRSIYIPGLKPFHLFLQSIGYACVEVFAFHPTIFSLSFYLNQNSTYFFSFFFNGIKMNCSTFCLFLSHVRNQITLLAPTAEMLL